jgi:phosphopantothenoylcysteine decarboxylase/phosphopantothenate--cysteine ligase
VLTGKRVLLIVSGGIAAYKSLELVRALKKRGAEVGCVLTKAAEAFVTPLSFASLSGEKVYSELFSLTDESEMGHIRLAPICSPRWRPGSPTTLRAPSCSRATSRSWPRPR